MPVTFSQGLENLEVKEGDSGVFCCELSKPGAPVDWRKGRVVLKPGYKYEMKQEGRFTKLIINNLEESDAGKYTCKTNDCQSTAELMVKGEERVDAVWFGKLATLSSHNHFHSSVHSSVQLPPSRSRRS